MCAARSGRSPGTPRPSRRRAERPGGRGGLADEAVRRVVGRGKKESDEIVQQFIDDFKSNSTTIRKELDERAKIMEGKGLDTSELEKNRKQLDDYDAEIEALLKKKQNRKFYGRGPEAAGGDRGREEGNRGVADRRGRDERGHQPRARSSRRRSAGPSRTPSRRSARASPGRSSTGISSRPR